MPILRHRIIKKLKYILIQIRKTPERMFIILDNLCMWMQFGKFAESYKLKLLTIKNL